MKTTFELRQRILKDEFGIMAKRDQQIIALAGNPNVGKSTIFNALTGLHQHTGNWPGKTVDNAQGTFAYKDYNFLLVDLPGTYSIFAHSAEEEVARNFLCFGEPDAVLIILDASSLERNLNLALQILEITSKAVVCINLLDEAAQRGLSIDLKVLRQRLGVPVIGTTARKGIGIHKIKETLCELIDNPSPPSPQRLIYSPVIEAAAQKVAEKLDLPALSHKKKRWLAMRLLEGETNLLPSFQMEAIKWSKS